MSIDCKLIVVELRVGSAIQGFDRPAAPEYRAQERPALVDIVGRKAGAVTRLFHEGRTRG